MAKLFIKQAAQYAEGRPSYPSELFEFIASKTPCKDLAWDAGTGSGQAARSVSFFPPSSRSKFRTFLLYIGFELGKLAVVAHYENVTSCEHFSVIIETTGHWYIIPKLLSCRL